MENKNIYEKKFVCEKEKHVEITEYIREEQIEILCVLERKRNLRVKVKEREKKINQNDKRKTLRVDRLNNWLTAIMCS